MRVLENDLPSALKLLADPTRLRILALLDREELSVGELSESLGMTQSRVSNHLRLLRDAELLTERHAGTSTYVRLDGTSDRHDVKHRLWVLLRGEVDALAEHGADLVRLQGVLERRRGDVEFFDEIAGHWDKIAGEFATGQAKHRAAAHLLPGGMVVADLGCGTGYLASALLGQVRKIVCVDRSQGMLDQARRRLGRIARTTEVEFRLGELAALPIDDEEVDGALAGMVLHHLEDPGGALAEMRRIVRPGGSVVILELAPHREAWMRRELGDRHLGLEASDVLAALGRAGFENVVLDPVEDRFRPKSPAGDEASLALYIARGRVPR
jgi:ArsR family transcriptional regulator